MPERRSFNSGVQPVAPPLGSARMELLEVVTVGLPFSCFKIVAGLSLLGLGGTWRFVGGALLCLGGADVIINTVNLVGLLFVGRRQLAVCLLPLVTHALRGRSGSPEGWRDLGVALDVLLSFALVALMIGTGGLRSMPASWLAAWNASVILNVLGAGLGRFADSLRKLREP